MATKRIVVDPYGFDAAEKRCACRIFIGKECVICNRNEGGRYRLAVHRHGPLRLANHALNLRGNGTPNRLVMDCWTTQLEPVNWVGEFLFRYRMHLVADVGFQFSQKLRTCDVIRASLPAVLAFSLHFVLVAASLRRCPEFRHWF